ncbi:RING-type E3 ubiquitin transferase [Heracleum sosnowskyi]|uniref:RING-type E3 ubiquitin transferase n=1 Tax=Heracleum sosnowskyi TaxID=360622 RepID=A0AAD8J4K0_9APIA|nr:RING-type E3 ubiquitin transferase [Heracleum sosnowskyi]
MFQVLSLLGLLPFDCQRFSVRQVLKRNRREVAGRACARGCRSVYSSITRYNIQSVAFIVEEMAEQHFLKYNDAGSWIQDYAMILSMCKEVPWYLDDGTSRVFVIGARGASGLALTVGSEVFEESGRSLVRGTLDYLQGLKMLGVKRTERVLPVGTPLTVVGEL